mgnify:CR=1 FL=1
MTFYSQNSNILTVSESLRQNIFYLGGAPLQRNQSFADAKHCEICNKVLPPQFGDSICPSCNIRSFRQQKILSAVVTTMNMM